MTHRRLTVPRLLAVLGVAAFGGAAGLAGVDPSPEAQQLDVSQRSAGSDGRLAPTAHPPLPNPLWMAPDHETGSVQPPVLARFVRGARLIDEGGDAREALPLVSAPALASTPLADYAAYYTGLAQMALGQIAQAEATFAALAARNVPGHISEDAALKEAELRERRKDAAGALAIYERLAARKTMAPNVVLARLGAAAEAAGRRDRAVQAYFDVYYEYPLSTEASRADSALTRLKAWDEGRASRFDRDLRRADTLYGARRWQPAKSAYERLQAQARGDVRSYVTIRVAAAAVQLREHKAARTALAPYLAQGRYAAEARFHHLTATRGLGLHDDFVRLARTLVAEHPDSPWAQEALDSLATHYILIDRRPDADQVFRETLRRFPNGRFADRAAWRSGWWAYRAGNYITAAHNCLITNWNKPWSAPSAFMNPPFNQPHLYLERLIDQHLSRNITESIALLKIGTLANQKTGAMIAAHASAVCCWGAGKPKANGRIAFIDCDGNQVRGGDFDSCLVYFGPRRGRFLEVFADYGMVSKVVA